ncbi:putative subtilase family serine protease [Neospora caninum Liverpool]|uniref:subtilisin n=1 Tax=Neospora caninum (strain Liverpool) TaxID=572307 RepID=F0VKJ3_NEOCL|nr:putative subtilase family serine protease [Neospora caninum Liverpool]CBZ54594.1 putative subtilase family serine protease [Neospora caninum Liverpool]CEL69308.1 TPA: subtilase family serine protease, putative [Neospora caninum Liverpool]|eukprot:XP_003884624.1 putative subtilase family serine protease [Neospora caninum Liverpool]
MLPTPPSDMLPSSNHPGTFSAAISSAIPAVKTIEHVADFFPAAHEGGSSFQSSQKETYHIPVSASQQSPQTPSMQQSVPLPQLPPTVSIGSYVLDNVAASSPGSRLVGATPLSGPKVGHPVEGSPVLNAKADKDGWFPIEDLKLSRTHFDVTLKQGERLTLPFSLTANEKAKVFLRAAANFEKSARTIERTADLLFMHEIEERQSQMRRDRERQQNRPDLDCRTSDGPCLSAGAFVRDSGSPEQVEHLSVQQSPTPVPYHAGRRLGTASSPFHVSDAAHPHYHANLGGAPAVTPSDDRRGGTRPRRRPELAARANGVQRAIAGAGDARPSSGGSEAPEKYAGSSSLDGLGRSTTGIPTSAGGRIQGTPNWQYRRQVPSAPNSSTGESYSIRGTGAPSSANPAVPDNPFHPLAYDALPVEPWEGWSHSLKLLAAETRKVDWSTSQRMLQSVRLQVGAAITSDLATSVRSDASDLDLPSSSRISGRRGEARGLGLVTKDVSRDRGGAQSSSTSVGSLGEERGPALPLSKLEVQEIDSTNNWQSHSNPESLSHNVGNLEASSPMKKLHQLVGEATEFRVAASLLDHDKAQDSEKRDNVPVSSQKGAGNVNFLSETRGAVTNASPSTLLDSSKADSPTANLPKRKTTKTSLSMPDRRQSQMIVVNVEALGSPIDKDTGRPLFYNDRILVGWRCSDRELLALKALDLEEEEEEVGQDESGQWSPTSSVVNVEGEMPSLSVPPSQALPEDPRISTADEEPHVSVPCAQPDLNRSSFAKEESERRVCGYVPPDLGIDIRSLRDSRRTTSASSSSSNPAFPLDLSRVSELWPNAPRPRNNTVESSTFANVNRNDNSSSWESRAAGFFPYESQTQQASRPGLPELSGDTLGAPPRRLQVLDRMLKSFASPEVESVKTLFRRLPQKRSLRKKAHHDETWQRAENHIDNQRAVNASAAQTKYSNFGLGTSSRDSAEARRNPVSRAGNNTASTGGARTSKGNSDSGGGWMYESEHAQEPGTGGKLEGGRGAKNNRDNGTENSKLGESVRRRLLDDDELCGMDLIKLSLQHYRARVEGTRHDADPANNFEDVEALKAFMKEFASHDYVGDILFLAPDAPIHAQAFSAVMESDTMSADRDESAPASSTSKHPTKNETKGEQAKTRPANAEQRLALGPAGGDSRGRNNARGKSTVARSTFPSRNAEQKSAFLNKTFIAGNDRPFDLRGVGGPGRYATSSVSTEERVLDETHGGRGLGSREQSDQQNNLKRSLQRTPQVSESGEWESGGPVIPNDPLFTLQWALGSPPQDSHMTAEFCYMRAREELEGRASEAIERGTAGPPQPTPSSSQLAKVRQLCAAAGHKDKNVTGEKIRSTALAEEAEHEQGGETDQQIWEDERGETTPDSASTLQSETHKADVQELEGDMENGPSSPSPKTSATLHALQGSHMGTGGGPAIGESSADTNSIDMVKAWQLSLSPQEDDKRKKPEVLVAVIDTGVNYIHSDLAKSIWVNEQELNGVPGFDDDQNGYIDDVYGWNFLHGNNNPMDDNGHGSHVAGIIGAQRNNYQGVSGISSHARIIALKILNKKGEGDVSHAIPAIRYALDNGAKVITNSWGGISGPGTQILGVLLKEAVADASGSVFVIAAGNDGMDISKDPYYPASFLRDWTITVAAHARDGALPKWSNYGHNTVHLTAPGENITSTWMGSGYRLSSGTSMAAPMVSGVAAEILAYNPMLQPQQVVDVLVQSAITDKRHANVSLTGARLNAYRAIVLSQLQFISLSPAELHVGGTADPIGEVEILFQSLMLPPGVYEGNIELVYSRRLASTRGLGVLSGVLKRRIVQLVQVTLPVKLTIVQ